jgi:hypothetical protein
VPTVKRKALQAAPRAPLRKVVRPIKTRVFVSFDFEHDRVLRDFVLGQAKREDSPFSVINHSMMAASSARTWKAEAEQRIARSEVVLVMVGSHTHGAQGVLVEIAIARRLGVPVRQMIGYRDTSPKPVPNAGRLYRWSWPTLKRLLAKPAPVKHVPRAPGL